MPNKILHLFFSLIIIIPVTIHAQISNGVIEYSVEILEIEQEKKIDKKYSNLMSNSRNSSRNITFELLMSDNKFLFHHKNNLVSDNDKFYKMALIFVEGNDKFFIDKKKDIYINQKSLLGELINIESKVPVISWILSDDRKLINGFQCKKAYFLVEKENQNRRYSEKIIAWYTPEIPIDNGPKCYQGLGGLILELQEGNVVYKVSSINLSTLDQEIKKPESKILMTKEEFDIHSKQKAIDIFGKRN